MLVTPLAMAIDILLSVVMPVLVLVALGAAVGRAKKVDAQALVSLNLYLFVPAFLFTKVSTSDLSWIQIGKIGLVSLLPMAVLGAVLYGGMRLMKKPGSTIATVSVGGLFYNAGNFGIPIAVLAFGAAGGAVQALVVMFVNTAIFFFGYAILALAQGRGARAVLGYFKLPMIYALTAALIVRELNPTHQPWPGEVEWLRKAIAMAGNAMVPIALVTLGVQLSLRARWPRWSLVGPVMFLKLLAMPLVTAGAVGLLGMWPWPGAQLILAAAGPTAINTLLLTLELDGDADSAAECVFWTTVFCAVSVTLTLVLIRFYGGDALPVPG